MFEQNTTENLNNTRDDLLQKAVEQLFSMVRHIHREFTPPNPMLSHPQARLVFTIAKSKDKGISVKELARTASMTPGAITQFVDALIAKDLVRREADLNDRRMVRLKLTSTAKSQMQTFRKDFLASAASVFDVLSTEELTQLIDILSKVSPQRCDGESHPKIF